MSDADGATSESTASITVTGTNDAPVANADTQTGHENETLTVDVLANDTDVDGDASSLSLNSVQIVDGDGNPVSGQGSVSIVNNQLQFVPGGDFDSLADGESATVTVRYVASDADGGTSESTASITITGTNDGPVANADTQTGHENETLTVDVLANDTDVDGDASSLSLNSVQIVDSEGNPVSGQGSVSIVNNQLQFVPGGDFDSLAEGESTTVTVRYVASDADGGTSESTASITITGTNDGPVANADTQTGHENETLTVDVLANDTDVDGDASSLSLDSVQIVDSDGNPVSGQGSVSIVDNQLQFVPGGDFDSLAEGESTTVNVRYVMSDADGATSESTASITVTGTNDAPVANADTQTGHENETLTIDVLANDTDVDGDASSLSLNSVQIVDSDGNPVSGQGSVSIVNNQLQFTPGGDFDSLADGESATVTVRYVASDADGGTSESTASITVTGTNDAPVANADTQTGHENETLTIDVLANDTDVDNASSLSLDSVQLVDGDGNPLSGHGSVSIVNNQLQFAPGSDFDSLAEGESTTVTVRYVMSDDSGATSESTASITVTGTNDAPEASADFAVDETGLIPVLTSNNDQGFHITSSDTFNSSYDSYKAFDNVDSDALNNQNSWAAEGSSAWLQVEMPEAKSILQYSLTGIADAGRRAPSEWKLLGSNDGVNFEVVDTQSSVTDWAPRETKTFSLSSAAEFRFLKLDITDNNGDSYHGKAYTGLDGFQLFEGTTHAAAGDENETLTIDVLANDTDVDGDASSLSLDSVQIVDGDGNPVSGQGSVSIVDNQLQFTPGSDFDSLADGESATVTVRYVMSDADGATSESTASITVTGTNDAPVANADTQTGHENETLTIDVLANDTDADHNDGPSSFSLDSVQIVDGDGNPLDGHGSVSIVNNQLQFVPGGDFDSLAEGESTTVTVRYVMSDDSGATSESTASITVTGTNDAPVANADTQTGHENETLTIDVLANDTDVDNASSLSLDSVQLVDGDGNPLSGHGSVSIVNNQLQFAPGSDFDSLAEGESTTVNVRYVMSDADGATSESTASITVTGTNDAPEASADFAVDETGLIPVLTSDNDQGFHITRSDAVDHQSLYDAYRAFDNIDAGEWNHNSWAAKGNSAWLQVEMPEAKSILQYSLTGIADSGRRAPSEWKLLGSNDGVNFEVVDTQSSVTDWASGETKTFSLSSAAEFRFLKLDITDNNGDSYTGLDGFQLFEGTTHAAAGDENETLTIDVLANDTDVDGDASSLSLDSVQIVDGDGNPVSGQGSVSIVDNQLQFTPGSDFDSLADGESATVTVRYVMSDADGATSESTASITVTGTNDAPVANADTQTGHENETLTIDVLANDTDADHNDGPSSFSLDSVQIVDGDGNPLDGHGSVSIVNNQLQFVPGGDFDSLAEGESTTVTVRYVMSDDSGATSESTASITVTGTNDAPVANADTQTGHENETLTIDVLANDTDADNASSLSLDSVQLVDGDGNPLNGHGSVSIVNNQLQFAPGSDFDSLAEGESTTVNVRYVMSDADGATSESTASITVTGTNDAPEASADFAVDETGLIPVLTSNNDQGFHITSSDTFNSSYDSYKAFDNVDSDALNNQNSWAAQGSSAWLQVEMPEAKSILQYSLTGIADAGRRAPSEWKLLGSNDGVNFEVVDTQSSVTDWAPRETKTFSLSSAAEFRFLKLDITDNNGDSYHGKAYTGLDGFQLFEGTTHAAAGDENETLTIDVLANDTDVDGDASSLSLNSVQIVDSEGNPVSDQGSVSIVNNQLQFVPGGDFDSLAEGESTTVTVRYVVSDEDGATSESTASITVTGTNDAPTAMADAERVNITGDNVVVGSLITDDMDPSEIHTFNVLNQPSEGSVSVLPNNLMQFELDGDSSDAGYANMDGVANDGVSYVQDPERGQVAEFNDEGMIVLAEGSNAADGLPAESMTVSGWVELDSADDWGGFFGLIQDNGPDEKGWMLGTRGQQFSFALKSDDNSSITYLTDEAASFELGKWYHVAATYDGDTMNLYVNGEMVISSNEQSGAITYPAQGGQLQIGAYFDDDEHNMHDGKLDDMRLYDTALTEAQIQQVMAGQQVGDYRFETGDDFQDLEPGETQDVSFTYEAVDHSGARVGEQGTVSITVTGTDGGPVADADTQTAHEHGAVMIDVLANDIDADDDASSLSLDSVQIVDGEGNPVSGQGLVSIVDNQLQFVPGNDFDSLAEGEETTVTVRYVMSDGDGVTSESTASITVIGTNDTPIANVDTQTGHENETLTIDVLANDTDADHNDGPSSFSLDSVQIVDGDGNPLDGHGSVSIVNNQLQFVPGGDFDSLTEGESTTVTVRYVMSDDSGATSESTANITVTGTNDIPEISTDVSVDETGVIAALHSNDDQGFHVTTSTDAGWSYKGYKAFDDVASHPGNNTNSWAAGGHSNWIQIELPEAESILQYSLTSISRQCGRAPSEWRLLGSNDGSHYEVLDTRSSITDWGAHETRTFDLSSAAEFKFFKLDVTDNEGDWYVGLDGFQLFEAEATSYTDNSGEVAMLDAVTLSDADDGTLQGATVQITGNYFVKEDTLAFTDQNGITGSWDADTGTLTLSGEATVAQYQEALQSITYANHVGHPHEDDRTLTITVNDGENSSATQIAAVVAVEDVNIAPEISGVESQITTTTLTDNQPGVSERIQFCQNGADHKLAVGEVIEITFTNSQDSSESYTVTHTVRDAADYRIEPALARAIDGAPGIGDLVSFVAGPIGSSYRNILQVDDNNRPPFDISTVIKDANGQVVSTDHAFTRHYSGGTPGTAGVAQVDEFTVPEILEVGQKIDFNVDGLKVSHTVAAGETAEDVRDSLLTQIEDSYDMTQIVTAAADGTNSITLTAVKAGVPFSAHGMSSVVADAFDVEVDENSEANTVIGVVGASDHDGVSDTLTYSLVDDAGGRFKIDSSTGEVTVADGSLLNFETASEHSIVVRVTDPNGLFDEKSVTVKVNDVNDASVANADEQTGHENETLVIDVLANDTDEDDALSDLSLDEVQIVDGDGNALEGHGSVSIVDNQLQFVPGSDFDSLAEGESTTVTVRYVMSDDDGARSESTATITITGTEDAPVANVDTQTGHDYETLTIDVLANDTDADHNDGLSNFSLDSVQVVDDNGNPLSGQGSVSIVNNQLQFVPGNDFDSLADGESTTVNVRYVMSDDAGVTSESMATITVIGTDGPPVVSADTPTGHENETLTIDVLANDANASADPSSFTLDSVQVVDSDGNPVSDQGSVSIVDNQLQFVPGGDFDSLADGESTAVSVRYVMSDDKGETFESTATIMVTGTDDAPVASADTQTGHENEVITIDVLANDTDVDHNDGQSSFSLDSVEIVDSDGNPLSGQGSVSIVNNQLQFVPGSDFDSLAKGESTTVTVRYVMSDDEGATSESTATITLTGTDDATVANVDTQTGHENETLMIDVLANDDVDNDSSSFSLDSVQIVDSDGNPLSGQGSVSIVDNQLQFVPGSDFDSMTEGESTTVTVRYVMSDSDGETYESTANITVTGTNDAPVASADAPDPQVGAAFVFSEDSGTTVADQSGNGHALILSDGATMVAGRDGTGYALDMNGNSSASIDGLETGGAMTVAAWVDFDSTGGWTRIIDFGNGPASDNILLGSSVENGLSVHVYDGSRLVGNVTVPNVVATGQWTHVAFTIDDAGEIKLFVDGAVVGTGTMSTGAPPDVMVRSKNLVGESNWEGNDPLDGRLDDLVIFNEPLTADQIGDLYQAGSLDEFLQFTTREHETITIDVLANDTDVDDDASSLSLDSVQIVDSDGNPLSGHGSVSIVDNQLQFTPGNDFNSLGLNESTTVTVRYVVSDADGATSESTATIVVTGTNDAPVANVDTQTGHENETLTIDVLANDTDVDHSSRFSLDSVQIVDGDGNPISGQGSVSIVDNQLQFVPGSDFDSLAEGESTTVTVRYVMSDDGGATSESTATITITGTNDAPTVGLDNNAHAGLVLDSDLIVDGDSATSGSWDTTGAAQVRYSNHALVFGEGTNATDGVAEQTLQGYSGVQYSLQLDYHEQSSRYGIASGTVEIIDSQSGTVLAEQAFSTDSRGTLTLPFTAISSNDLTVRISDTTENGFSRDLWIDDVSLVASSADNSALGLTGIEDQPIAVDLAVVEPPDSDDSIPVTIELSDIPSGVVLHDGANTLTSTGEAIDVSGWDLDSLTLTSPANSQGGFTFTVTAISTSATGATTATTRAIDVHIDEVNDAPEAHADTQTGHENETLMIDVLANDTDENYGDDTSSFSLDSVQIVDGDGNPLTDQGTVSIVDNQLQFVPGDDFDSLADGENATVTVRYVMSDDEGATSESTATITVTGTDDAPTVSLDNNAHAGLALDTELISNGDFRTSESWNMTGTAEAFGPEQLLAFGRGNIAGEGAAEQTVQGYSGVQYSLQLDYYKQGYTGTVSGKVEIIDSESGTVLADQAFSSSSGTFDTLTLPFAAISSNDLTIRISDTTADGAGRDLWIDNVSLVASSADNSELGLSGIEDQPIAVDLAVVAPPDSDGSNPLVIELSGIPSGVVLHDGTNTLISAGGAMDVSDWNLADLTLTPPANNHDDFTLTVTASSTNATGTTTTTTQAIDVHIDEVNDAPVLDATLDPVVNTETEVGDSAATGDQNQAHSDSAADGAITVWHSEDGGSHVILASLPDGTEFQVNEVMPSGTQELVNPEVAVLDNGNFAVTWGFHEPGVQRHTCMRVFDADGAEIKGEFTVAEHHYNEHLIALDNNTFAVSSSDHYRGGNDHHVRLFDADGTETHDIIVGDGGSYSNGGLSLAALDNGGFAATWRGGDGTDSDAATLMIYDASGNSIAGPVNYGGAAPTNQADIHQTEVDIEVLGNGELLTAYQSGDDLYFQRWTDSGSAEGSPVKINTTDGFHADVTVESLEDGSFFVAWRSVGQDGEGREIYGRHFDATGNALTDEILINTTTEGSQFDPEITQLADGDLLITWTSGQDGDNDVYSTTLGLGNHVSENVADGTVVGRAVATDSDAGDTLTYSLVDDAGGRFRIDSRTGEVTVADGSLLDFETATSHTVRARVVDADGLSSEQDIAISVMDANDAPTAAPASLVTAESEAYVFAASDFGFKDEDGDSLHSVTIKSLPVDGSLTYDGADVYVNQVIAAEDISMLQFTAPSVSADTSTSFSFTVSDGTDSSDYQTLNISTVETSDQVEVSLSGSSNDDVMLGTDGTDNIQAGAGDDTIIGGAGDDTITGGAGDDTITGGAGDDTIIGGEGDDLLTGGSGADVFQFNDGDEGTVDSPAVDTIEDFNIEEGDVLDLSDMLVGESVETIDAFLDFGTVEEDGVTSTQILVKDGADGQTVQQINLDGVDLSSLGSDADILNNLLNNGNLDVDP